MRNAPPHLGRSGGPPLVAGHTYLRERGALTLLGLPGEAWNGHLFVRDLIE